MRRFGFSRLFALTLAGLAAFGCSTARGQSVDENSPSPLSEGVNHGAVDSMAGGANWWMVVVNPGNFEVRYTHSGPQEFVSTGQQPRFGCNFRPKIPGATVQYQPDRNGNVVCHGSTPKRTTFVMAVFPPAGSLVRQSFQYDLSVTGSVDYSGAPAPGTAVDNVAGVYKPFFGQVSGGHVYTMVKFGADGRITSPEGYSGAWKLFDVSSKTYSIQFDGHQFTDLYRAGVGFVEAGGSIDFQYAGH